MNLEKKIRNFLKVDNNFKLLIVFIVFGITGSLTLYISDILFIFFDISKNELGYFYIFIRILIIFSNLPTVINNYWNTFWRI